MCAFLEGWDLMPTKAARAVMTVLLLAGCAMTTPAPRFSAVGPADEDGPEANAPPPSLSLAAETEAQVSVPPEVAPKPGAGHEGHSMPVENPAALGSPSPPAAARPEDLPYSCPMHPEVKRASPGPCPKCGMPLVRRKDGSQ